MILHDYHMKNVKLTDFDDAIFSGKAYFCDKEDYDAEEDGVELEIDGVLSIFYTSDIKSIEVV